MRFYYKVWVDVEDDLEMPTEYYGEDYIDDCDEDYDEEGNLTARWLSPEAKARIVIGSRLGHDEELGIGNYQIDWESLD